MQKPLLVALSFLPPGVVNVLQANGFAPLRIEPSGALRLTISNELPVEKKSNAVLALKKTLKEYGLDLTRAIGGVSSNSAADESCLVVKRDLAGTVAPLFKESGQPYPELADLPAECMTTSSGKGSQKAPGR